MCYDRKSSKTLLLYKIYVFIAWTWEYFLNRMLFIICAMETITLDDDGKLFCNETPLELPEHRY